jgi:glycosyltransferase involved in cell wall biosynthesis
VRSAVRDGVSGIIVPPNEVRSVADAIRELLRNPHRRIQMGHDARSLVETHYNWERVARDTREFTERVIKL